MQAQGRILVGAGRLFVLAVVPMLVMVVPVTLLLGQLSLWYQERPLRVGEEAVVTVKLNGDADVPLPEVSLEPDGRRGGDGRAGPRASASARSAGTSRPAKAAIIASTFQVGDQTVDKELAVGDGFMRVSAQRPGWDWSDVLLNPVGEAVPRPTRRSGRSRSTTPSARRGRAAPTGG